MFSFNYSRQGQSKRSFPGHIQQLLQGNPEAVPTLLRYIILSACPWFPVVSSQLVSSTGKYPGGILNDHNWLLYLRRSRGSAPSPSQMSELLATMQRRLGFASCIRDLVLLVNGKLRFTFSPQWFHTTSACPPPQSSPVDLSYLNKT